MPEKHLRLSELTARIEEAIRDHFAGQHFWVIADVTSHQYKPDKNYHHFELIEKDPHSRALLARVNGKAWGSGSEAIANFERLTGQSFGGKITALMRLEVQYHPSFGLQANLTAIDVNFTLGALEQQRRLTLQRLLDQNPGIVSLVGDRYITRNQQMPLPVVIQRVAVISSHTSAGAEDLRHTLTANSHGYMFSVSTFHTPVQGDQYADEIVRQMIRIYDSINHFDVVVITRGGGSQADFLIFDNYKLAQAIARFPIPVITGIGHQRNESICDMMAHTAARTPTKAGEFIIAHNRSFEEKVLNLQHQVVIRTQQRFAKQAEQLSSIHSLLIGRTNRTVSSYKEQLHHLSQLVTTKSVELLYHKRHALLNFATTLTAKPQILVSNQLRDLKNTMGNLHAFTQKWMLSQSRQVAHYEKIMKLMSPLHILDKGFAIIKVNNQICAQPGTLQPGDEVDIVMASARINALITGKTDQDATTADL